LNYSRWLLQKFTEPNFIEKIVIGDEAGFAMNGRVNTFNVVHYAPKGQPPDFTFDVSNSRVKVTAWEALCGNGNILGPHFF